MTIDQDLLARAEYHRRCARIADEALSQVWVESSQSSVREIVRAARAKILASPLPGEDSIDANVRCSAGDPNY